MFVAINARRSQIFTPENREIGDGQRGPQEQSAEKRKKGREDIVARQEIVRQEKEAKAAKNCDEKSWLADELARIGPSNSANKEEVRRNVQLACSTN